MATLPVGEIEGFVYKRLDGGYRGWRVELLVEQITNKMEEKFLLCSYCSGLMRDACLLEKEGKQEVKCFVCIPEGVTWQPALMNREVINEKIIRCPLNERGCNWTNTVSRGVQHLEECEFLPVLCPRKCVESDGERSGEVVRLERRQMAEHEREYCPQRELECEFCGRVAKACEMNPHLGECEEFPLDCPNGCEVAETGTGQMKRGDVPLHLTECPLQRVECPYREYGCGEEMERRQLDLHEREYMHTHFRLAMKEIKQKQIESDNKIKVLEKLSAEKDLENISIKKEMKQSETLSLDLKRKQIESNEKILFLEKQNAVLTVALSSTLVSTGRLEWNIKGVKQKIEKKEYTYSDPFYVGMYKCQLMIVWDWINTGKVGCWIRNMKGEFDDKLKWPFIYKCKFILLNQNRNENNHIKSEEVTKETLQKHPECFRRPTGIRNLGWGTASFISNNEILTEKYCKEDSISIHLTVEELPPF